MPSRAYLNFLHMRVDVLRLIETHSDYTQNRPGRKMLGHLTRSAVVMLCAAWERYNEDLLIETIDEVNNLVNDLNQLNKGIKGIISRKVKEDKIETKPIELAGSGWKVVWKNYAIMETESLHTPKSENLRKLFKRYLGIPDYTRFWASNNPLDIDDFVKDRGDIAHNGSKAKYIQMNKLRKYQDLIIQNVINIDSEMADEIMRVSASANLPWTKDYYTSLDQYN